MKKNISKKLITGLKSKGILAVSAAMLMVSCGVQMGGYSETDGVYYDPNRDTLPEATADMRGNRVGDYYDYQNSDETEIYGKYGNYRGWKEKVLHNDSDWGNYTGTERVYSSWDSPYYGYYSPYYGYGSRFGMSFGWGSSMFGYGYSPFGYFDSFYGYYSPFYSSFYYPYAAYYSPYYGYYSPYYGYGYGYGYGNSYYSVPRRNVGPDGFRTNGSRSNATNGYGFRNSGSYSAQDGRMSQYPSGRMQQPVRTGENMRRMPSSDQPRFRSQPENTYRNESYRNNNDGFRNGGFRNESSGGFQNSGGFSGGSSSSARSGGGFRTGGFR